MDSINNIKIEDIEGLFDSEIFGRGEEYFNEGLVKDMELIDDKTLIGTVIGNNKYKVTISIDSDGEIACDCTCPCDFSCKHAVALLLRCVNEENELSSFLNDWFEVFGEIFTSTKPTTEEKKNFIDKIKKLVEKDEYGFNNDIERALYGMCRTKEDIELIKENYKIKDWYYDEKTGKEGYDYEGHNDFYLELYEKIGADKEYLNFAKEKGFSIEYLNKLISLGKLKEALEECNKQKKYNDEIEERKYNLLKKLNKNKEAQEVLFKLTKYTCSLDLILKLKKESSSKEWEKFKKEIIEEAKKTKINEIISKIYYHEEDYLNAYEYAKNLTNSEYMELLAKKLSEEYPDKACSLLRKLIFQWILSGSGYPYKKARKLLEEIKIIDNSGSIFKKIKNEVINEHKKKYSLMNIIEKI